MSEKRKSPALLSIVVPVCLLRSGPTNRTVYFWWQKLRNYHGEWQERSRNYSTFVVITYPAFWPLVLTTYRNKIRSSLPDVQNVLAYVLSMHQRG